MELSVKNRIICWGAGKQALAGLLQVEELYDIKYIDRGYVDIEGKMAALGADITREDAEPEI